MRGATGRRGTNTGKGWFGILGEEGGVKFGWNLCMVTAPCHDPNRDFGGFFFLIKHLRVFIGKFAAASSFTLMWDGRQSSFEGT